MQVTFKDKEYNFNLEEITVLQAKIIKAATGFTLVSLETGLDEADPDALRAIFWLMMVQNGEAVPIERVDFKIMEFAKALQAGSEKEAKEQEAKEAADKAAGVPVEAPKDPA